MAPTVVHALQASLAGYLPYTVEVGG